MAFSPFARFRNFTVKNLKALLEIYPDMAKTMSWNQVGDEIEQRLKGYKKTAYQQACQFGLEDKGRELFRVQEYLYAFDDENLKRYLEFWIKTYFAPNPYVNAKDEPILIYCEILKEIIESEELQISFEEFFQRRIGGKSDDILLNTLKEYGKPIQVSKENDVEILKIDKEKLAEVKDEILFIEENFAIGDHLDKRKFFDRYSYESYCKFYGLDCEDQSLETVDWKCFLFEALQKIDEKGNLQQHLKSLQDKSFCETQFKHGYAILKEVTTSSSKEDSKDNNGYLRYYRDPIVVSEKKYIISKEWYNYPEHRIGTKILFEDWIRKQLNSYNRVTGAENVLLYGVPGVGKSHKIRTEYCCNEMFIERVVFHPDYTYSDFVGQILPRVEETSNGDVLKYIFTQGPFTKILKKAYDDPQNYYYLVIEELNRGNAPAIFGEIFQLLDRKEEDAYPKEEIGESEYGITNYDVAKVLHGKKNETVKIRIPSNLYILSTMNTADQNVFTLDTAFQRRWRMQQVENRVDIASHAKKKIGGTRVRWDCFVQVVNDLIVEINTDMIGSEDKRLGAYFAKSKELEADRFSEKVLKYLWDDAFKMEKSAIFKDEFKSLDALINGYRESEGDKLSVVLRSDVYKKMVKLVEADENMESDAEEV